jgi:NAD(P)-dependent dehydrogenase (short-subunit alcohol dehydrogenase family)
MNKLEGKVALVTGGTSGIGLATAKRFVAEGAHVFITGRRQTELDAAVEEIGKNVTGVQSDVSKMADLVGGASPLENRLFAKIEQAQGHLDVVFANAGGGEIAPLGSITESHFDKMKLLKPWSFSLQMTVAL